MNVSVFLKQSSALRHSLFVFALAFGTSLLAQISAPSFSEAESKNPFQVGLVLPLTGPAADYGVAIKNSIELAAKDRPELFTNVRFRYEDTAYDPKAAVTALNKLYDIDKVNLSVTWGVSFCKALAPIAETRKTPLVGICLDPTIAVGRHYILRFESTTDEIMKKQADYLFAHGVKRIGLLLAEHPYLAEISQALKRNLHEGQTLTVIDQLPNTVMDLRTTILKLEKKKKDYDSIGIFLFMGQISTFYNELRDLKFDLPTFGTALFESLSELHASSGAMNGVVFTSIGIKDAFIKEYVDVYHNQSQLAFGAPAYEFALTIGNLFNKTASDTSADDIMKAFSTVKEQAGVASGPYRYVNDPKTGQYFQFPTVVKKISGETFEVVQ